MKTIAIIGLMLFTLFNLSGLSEEKEIPTSMVQHPEWYIKITDWSFYATRGVAIIHHVTIENTSEIANETGVLNVVLPPHSKKTYLEGGAVLGAGSSLFNADNIEVLGALPATGAYDKGIYPKLTL